MLLMCTAVTGFPENQHHPSTEPWQELLFVAQLKLDKQGSSPTYLTTPFFLDCVAQCSTTLSSIIHIMTHISDIIDSLELTEADEAEYDAYWADWNAYEQTWLDL